MGAANHGRIGGDYCFTNVFCPGMFSAKQGRRLSITSGSFFLSVQFDDLESLIIYGQGVAGNVRASIRHNGHLWGHEPETYLPILKFDCPKVRSYQIISSKLFFGKTSWGFADRNRWRCWMRSEVDPLGLQLPSTSGVLEVDS